MNLSMHIDAHACTRMNVKTHAQNKEPVMPHFLVASKRAGLKEDLEHQVARKYHGQSTLSMVPCESLNLSAVTLVFSIWIGSLPE